MVSRLPRGIVDCSGDDEAFEKRGTEWSARRHARK